MVTPREQLQQSQYAQGYRRRRRGTSALLSRSVVGRSLLASAPDRGTAAQTWPRHPCHPWGLKTTGFEREIVAPPDRKPLIFQLYNNFCTSKYALKTRQAY